MGVALSRPLVVKIVFFATIMLSCETSKKTDQKESVPKEPSETSFNKKKEVIKYLLEAGFGSKKNGKYFFRDEQISKVASDKIIDCISVLSSNPNKEDLHIIFFLKIAGACQMNETKSRAFIKDIILGGDYLDDMERMTIFLQRQERPIIQRALTAVAKELNSSQCADYLEKVGYAAGETGNIQFSPEKLRNTTRTFRLVLADQLVQGNKRQKEVANQLKIGLGILS